MLGILEHSTNPGGEQFPVEIPFLASMTIFWFPYLSDYFPFLFC